eukprot:10085676-Alexandrium_andersonii.AAC.1
MLAMILKRGALKLIRRAEEENGFEAYRVIFRRYGGGDDEGATAQLQSLVRFNFGTKVTDVEDKLASF